MKSRTRKYREILDELERHFHGGNYEDFSCGNTMGLYVRNPCRCISLFEKFNRIKNEPKSKNR